MLDIITKIAGLVRDALIQFQSQKDRSRKRRFGKAAVTCYLRLLEVIDAADRIFREFEFFEQRYRKHLERNDNWEYESSELRSTSRVFSLQLSVLSTDH